MNRYAKLLQRCRNQFSLYAAAHAGKTPPQEEKAAVNRGLVSEIDDTLALDADHDYNHMVEVLKKPGDAILAKLEPVHADALHMALGVCGEAGELADAIKKWAIYGKELDRDNVVEELGDLEFFMQGIREIVGITRDETLHVNMIKLGTRYEKFQYSDAQAIARADKQEGITRQHVCTCENLDNSGHRVDGHHPSCEVVR